eukprot:Skav200617  [mRNA]  locus=scaffold2029:3408:6608:+ [translate_table: standard]
MLRGVIASLNSLYGVSAAGSSRRTLARDRIVKRLSEAVDRCNLGGMTVPRVTFHDFFMFRGLDYAGEEIKLARSITWEQIEASLPSEVGSLDIREFCEGGVLDYVNNFPQSLVPEEMMTIGKTPKVMCSDSEWPKVVDGLVTRGLCQVVDEADLFHIGSRPLLNGLFSVSKQEFVGPVELCRLIMNLKPLNANCKPLEADTCTLPSVTQLGSVYLEDGEVLCTSSGDLRCYFYLFSLPQAWIPYLGFGKPIPPGHGGVPLGEGRKKFLASRVLPMGFLNSVGIAQHIHRLVVRRSMGSMNPPVGGELELRRDRVMSSGSRLYRVYLDNFAQLTKVNRRLAELIKGAPTPEVLALRRFYQDHQLLIHPKKTVEQELGAEIQGAWLDGNRGTCMAKPVKIFRYVALALCLLGEGKASQKELQIVGGGMVYISMFKRQVLGSLNQVWRDITTLDSMPDGYRAPLRKATALELCRFIGLVPLAFMDLRSCFDPLVTASDASASGGGLCISRGLSPYGQAAAASVVRGDVPEDHDFCQVLSIGMFDGISGLRVALDMLGAPVAGHISIEQNVAAQRVVEANFGDVIQVDNVLSVDFEMVQSWALKFSSVGLVVVGAGPPCQGVSGLNSDRRGALRDSRSCLYVEVPRVERLVRRAFPWAQVHWLVENVASMDGDDCQLMCDEFDDYPYFIDASGISLAHRPRLYWVSWELCEGEGVSFLWGSDGRLPLVGEVKLVAEVESKAFLEPGWTLPSTDPLPTFTAARPSLVPLRRPAGLKACKPHELDRWRQDLHRFPPYQYRDRNCLVATSGERRTPSVLEREVILGFPPGYTTQCCKKAEHGTMAHCDTRLTLLGNSWSVPVVSWLLACLLIPLGLVSPCSLQELVSRFTPGKAQPLQTLLGRPPLTRSTKTLPASAMLVKKLAGLVSLKGEDLLLQSASDIPVRYHRLRASVPARLWRWQIVSGWRWSDTTEHINVLELRAVFTSVKYRIQKLHQVNLRCVHLVDSLVVLHALARGRSSSRKMRRTLMRLNALLLASGLQPTWGYVDAHQNPADRPSRRYVKKRWVKVQPRC